MVAKGVELAKAETVLANSTPESRDKILYLTVASGLAGILSGFLGLVFAFRHLYSRHLLREKNREVEAEFVTDENETGS
jgi:hypothetical protein